eukprot:15336081-Ditylum_brightwellii.AAC.1
MKSPPQRSPVLSSEACGATTVHTQGSHDPEAGTSGCTWRQNHGAGASTEVRHLVSKSCCKSCLLLMLVLALHKLTPLFHSAGQRCRASTMVVHIYLQNLLLVIEENSMEGFKRSCFSLVSSVSSGVEAMGPSAYFIRAFCVGEWVSRNSCVSSHGAVLSKLGLQDGADTRQILLFCCSLDLVREEICTLIDTKVSIAIILIQ